MKKKRFQLLSNLRKFITNNLCWRIRKNNQRKQKIRDIETEFLPEATLSSKQTPTQLNPDISTQKSARSDLEIHELFSLEDDISLLILLTEGNARRLPFPAVRREILPVIPLHWITKTADIREGNTIEMQIGVPVTTRYEELERSWITSRIFECSWSSYPSLPTKMQVVPYVCKKSLFYLHLIAEVLHCEYEQLSRPGKLESTNQGPFPIVRQETLKVIPLPWITKISDIREGNTVEMQTGVPITIRYEELQRSWITSRIFECSWSSYPSLPTKMQVIPYVCKKSLFYLHLIAGVLFCEYEPLTRPGKLESTNQGSKGDVESTDSGTRLSNAKTGEVIAGIHTIKSQPSSENRISKLPSTDTLEVNWSLITINIKEIHLTSLLVEDGDYKKMYRGYYGDTHFVASDYRRIPKKLDMNDLGRLRSPNLPELFGILQYNSHRWVIYEEAKFGDLHTLLKKDPQSLVPAILKYANRRKYIRTVFGEDSAKFVTVKLLLALAYLQTHGVVHGDIRPSKILINNLGMPMLGGLETVTWPSNRTLVRRSPKSIKIGFVAPEVLTGFRPQPASDIFSLGCVAYFIITGRRPFRKRNELLKKMKGPELLDKKLSPAGIEFITACLQKSIGRRFQLGIGLKYVRQNKWLADTDIDEDFPRSSLMKAIEHLTKVEAHVEVEKDPYARQ